MTVSSETLRSISTPEQLKTRLGALDFIDGVPSPGTVELVYDHLDYVHALNVFLNGFAGASTVALRKGLAEAGADDNQVLTFSELMDSASLFLTANADTAYFLSMVDLRLGPMVVETPPQSLGMFDDRWWQWIVDFGLPGPDRGEGGRYLLLPPGYDGPLPDSGYHVGHSRTTRAFLLGRAFINENPGMDPAPTVELIKRTTKIYPYVQGGFGTSVATLLEGDVPPGTAAGIPETVFVEASGKAFNTIPPNDLGFYELLNELVQEEPAGSTDIELMGQLASIGIVKGKPFAPDERMRRILEEAAAVGSATSRALVFDPRVGRVRVLRRLGVGQHAVGRRLRLRDPAAAGHRGGDQAVSSDRGTGAGRPNLVVVRLHRVLTRAVHAADRNRVAVRHRQQGRRREPPRRRQDLPGDPAARHSGGTVLVAHRLRQRDPLDAADTAALPPRREPVLPDPGGDRERRRLHDRHVQPGATRRQLGGQLDPDRPWQGLVRAPAPLQPTRPVLRQELAAERDRSREDKPMIKVPTNGRGHGHPYVFVQLRKAQPYIRRTRPRAHIPVPVLRVPEADGQRVQRASATSERARDDRRPIDDVDVSREREAAGHVSLLRQRGGHVSLLP
jgi:hypothetical protein